MIRHGSDKKSLRQKSLSQYTFQRLDAGQSGISGATSPHLYVHLDNNSGCLVENLIWRDYNFNRGEKISKKYLAGRKPSQIFIEILSPLKSNMRAIIGMISSDNVSWYIP